MKIKGRLLWLQILMIPCLALFFVQCGDSGGDEDPAQPACAVSLLQGGTYRFTVSDITDNCWQSLQVLISQIPAANITLPSGNSSFPYDLSEPGIVFPVIGAVTGSLVTTESGEIEFEPDPDALEVELDLAELSSGFCTGTLTLNIQVVKIRFCPTQGNKVTARVVVRITEVPDCPSCSCPFFPSFIDKVNSTEPNCQITLELDGSL